MKIWDLKAVLDVLHAPHDAAKVLRDNLKPFEVNRLFTSAHFSPSNCVLHFRSTFPTSNWVNSSSIPQLKFWPVISTN